MGRSIRELWLLPLTTTTAKLRVITFYSDAKITEMLRNIKQYFNGNITSHDSTVVQLKSTIEE